MFPKFSLDNKFQAISIAIIIALVLGIVTFVFFIVIEKDSYSSMYIVPDSIIRTSGDDAVLFEYGVQSSESGKMDYTLNIFLNEQNVKTKQFSLNRGELLEEQDKILLPSDIQYPSKISLNLTTKSGSEEVHFWLK
jgi:hypothetical protein